MIPALPRSATGPRRASFDEPRGLVFDDVVLDKTGRRIQGIHRLFSSSLDTTVLALNVVVMGWTNGKVFIPLTFRFWKPPSEKGSKLAFDGTPLKTKIDLAIEMLDWAQSGLRADRRPVRRLHHRKEVFKVLEQLSVPKGPLGPGNSR